MTTATILIVEDEPSVRFGLEEVLRRDGYVVDAVESGAGALAQIARHQYELALLDIRLQDMTGLEVLAALRKRSPETVAIILTAHASVETAVEALRQGAHDYLFKPCKTDELRQSVRSGLARYHEHVQLQDTAQTLETIQQLLQARPETGSPAVLSEAPLEAAAAGRRILQHDDLFVDRQRHVATLRGELLPLSPTEFQILVCLLAEAPRVVSPLELVQEIQGYQVDEGEARQIISYHIYRMRRKIKETAGEQELIRTVRGVGYTIV